MKSEYAAYCLDGATATLGVTIENALAERIEVDVGTTKKSVAKYTLQRLLAPDFELPRPSHDVHGESGDIGLLKGAAGGFYDEVK